MTAFIVGCKLKFLFTSVSCVPIVEDVWQRGFPGLTPADPNDNQD
jgi:hypothetical protein